MDAINFPKLEEEILKHWKEQKTFEKSVAIRRAKGKRFVFYEGPPTANAKPGIHHVLGRVFKDIILRYKTMRGFLVERRAGWDTHGLPVELQIEKKLGLKSKKEIEQYGIAKFNAECKQSVWEFKKDWESLTERIGFWIDMEHPYITYETSYIETLWFIISQFWKKKLLYKGHKVVPWCVRCGTVLSSHELAQGYKTITDQSVYVKFKIQNTKTYLLAWTTTPWTLPGNVALAVNPEITYVLVEKDGEQYILAKDLAQKVLGDHTVVKVLNGKDLIGFEYEPLFNVSALRNEKSHKVYAADFVTTAEGTGIVHIAPMYGEDDYNLGKKVGLPQHHTVNEQGKFTTEVPGLEGLPVTNGTEKNKETEQKILEILKAQGSLLETAPYPHEYPHCWRCSTPLLYYAKETWFVNMQEVKKRLIQSNQKVNWIPSHIKNGRMGEWLKEVKDWAFSRERYWGTPLPVWQCLNCKNTEVVGSLEELKKKKFTTNSYYILRHGHSEKQLANDVMACWPEKIPYHLTQKGKKKVAEAAKELKKKKIDMIFSSDLMRTKDTAEILGKELGIAPVFDARLREWDVGILNGKPLSEFGKIYGRPREIKLEHYLRRFIEPAPHGESWQDMQRRMYGFLKEVDQKYYSKNIVIISHQDPLSMLETMVRGFTREQVVDYLKNQKKGLHTGEWRALPFALLPYNENMEIDLHRPFVDDVVFLCSACNKGKMKRVKEVVDVWFDSGAMPFASKSPFPADYIVEGIDQTRGWFYTLLAVSTLLGFEAPYKNVISFSHVLDEKGEKMSKSKGNTVDPVRMLEQYGADAVRWYFFTINNPGDSKLFSEKDIQETIRRFLLTFWNSFVFYQTYTKDVPLRRKKTSFTKLANVLDKWILSRLNGTIKEIAEKLDAYDVTGAARAIENFAVQDLSLWYIRRSRPRFQNPKNQAELKHVSQVLGFVLSEVCKLVAPFIPFLSEYIFQNLGGKGSVHWQNFPKAKARDQKLEAQMVWIRDIVAKALAERATLGIKVRQPLQTLKIKNFRLSIPKDLLNLLADEVNVKEILFDATLAKDMEFDVRITPELKEEGMRRELMRQIQGMRKDAEYKPSDRIVVLCAGDSELCSLLLKEVKIYKFQEPTLETTDRMKEIEIDQKKLRVGIKKL